MIRSLIVLLAAAAPAAAQTTPLSFEAGRSLPITQGEWSYVATATGSEARYGTVLTLRCERQIRTVAMLLPAQPNAMLTVATGSLARDLPAGGRLLASDQLLDAIAFSRGRFLVRGGAGPILAIPSWPEAARAIEDCRN